MAAQDRRARVPQVGRILADERIASRAAALGRPLVARTVSATVARVRDRILLDPGFDPDPETVIRECESDLVRLERTALRRVINATGIVLHTNLGRSPLPRTVWEAAADINTGYSNLEFDLESGRRGRRGGLAPRLLAALTGAEAALVVNNNAAGLLLALSGLAAGREVVVSRGEAVQIGGGFRIPDILRLSGATLVETGTTNVTRIDDYRAAIGPRTAAVLTVHSSNFTLRGFTEKPELRDLARALPPGIPLLADQGSGCMDGKVPGEIPVARMIRDGAHLVCFSGDKLFGGPQAGVLAGRRDIVESLATHPLMRAIRPGKAVLSLLEATALAVSREAAVAPGTGPGAGQGTSAVRRALALSTPAGLAELERSGAGIVAALPPGRASVVASLAAFGGGSSPDEYVPSRAIELVPAGSATGLAACLRRGTLPVIGRIANDRVVLDLATMAGEDPGVVATLLRDALARESERPGPERNQT